MELKKILLHNPNAYDFSFLLHHYYLPFVRDLAILFIIALVLFFTRDNDENLTNLLNLPIPINSYGLLSIAIFFVFLFATDVFFTYAIIAKIIYLLLITIF